MQYSRKLIRLIVMTVALAGVVPVFAAGTDAGTVVTNDVTLDYSVNGGAQPTVTDSIAFTVDRSLAVIVSTNDADLVGVTIGQTFTGNTGVPAISFDVQNTSNAGINIILGVVDQDGTPITGFATTGTGFFNEAGFTVALDDGIVNGVYDDGSDTLLTLDGSGGFYQLGAMTEDQIQTVLVVIDVPLGAAADEQASYTLVAAVADGGNAPIALDESGNIAPNSGAAPVNNADTSAQQDVFADSGTTDPEDERYDFFASVTVPNGGIAGLDVTSNGQHSDSSGFIVSTADLQVAKSVEVLYDAFSTNRYDNNGDLVPGTNAPKAIPGSVLMYVIGFSNEDAVFIAESVAIADDIEDGAAIGLTEPVDEGNQSGATVNVPGEVTLDLDTGVGVNNHTFTLPVIVNLDQIYIEDCSNTATTQAYPGTVVLGGPDVDITTDEISALVGDCAPTEDGFIVYFVTVSATN